LLVDLADVGKQVVAVADRRGSEFSDQRVVLSADGSDHGEALPDRQLRGDDPNRPASAQDQESLALRGIELAQNPDRRLDRSGQRAASL
jgi:hypothetical protein